MVHRFSARVFAAALTCAAALLAASVPAQAAAPPPPGGFTPLVNESFSTGAVPAGWGVVEQGDSTPIWQFTDPGHRGNQTGGTGGFAIIDSAWYYAGPGSGHLHSSILTPYLTKPANSVVTVSFRTRLLCTAPGTDSSAVQWSLDKGKDWTTAWSETNTSIAPGTRVSFTLPAAVTAAKHLTVRWTNRSYDAGYWEVDDVSISAI